jgi:hypothetical protein
MGITKWSTLASTKTSSNILAAKMAALAELKTHRNIITKVLKS